MPWRDPRTARGPGPKNYEFNPCGSWPLERTFGDDRVDPAHARERPAANRVAFEPPNAKQRNTRATHSKGNASPEPANPEPDPMKLRPKIPNELVTRPLVVLGSRHGMF